MCDWERWAGGRPPGGHISAGTLAGTLHLYDNYFVFVFDETIGRSAAAPLLGTNLHCGKLKPPGPLPRRGR